MAADPRALASQVLVQVTGGQSLSEALPPFQRRCEDPRDAALVQELVYGTLRWYHRLDAMLGRLMRKPLKSRDADLHALLLTGLYQLDRLSMPQHVAVHATVQSVRTLRKEWASGLVNGVLRSYLRDRDGLDTALADDDVARYSHPDWLIERLRADWPQCHERILEANNERPPFSLRVNQRRLRRDDYLELLRERSMEAQPIPETEHGIVLSQPMAAAQLPGFQAGDVSVQDGAAQLAAVYLDVQPGMRVLDACAAPGGKTAHLLERYPQSELLAIDIDAGRLARVRENLDRLGLQAQLLAADALKPDSWWDGRRFDRILLDAPCTGSGVIRRHPDIKLLRRAADVGSLVQRQAELLYTLWPLLLPGGMLLYCTCSVLRQENSLQITGFLQVHADASERQLLEPRGGSHDAGRQILPGEHGMDGFYYACLIKSV